MFFLLLDLINFGQLFTARGKMNAKKLEKASLSERKKRLHRAMLQTHRGGNHSCNLNPALLDCPNEGSSNSLVRN